MPEINDPSTIGSDKPDDKAIEIPILQKIAELPDDETAIKSFVQERISSLGKNERKKFDRENDFIDNPILSGFIDKDFLIRPGLNPQVSFKLDDEDIYCKFIRDIKDTQYNGLNDHEKTLRTVQDSISSYFTNIAPSPEKVEIRNKKFDSPGPSFEYSISDNKEGALCSERASVAHNLLLLCGEESYFAVGYMKEESAYNKTEELHNFLITKNSQGYYEIFDPTNPVLCYSNKQREKLITYIPFIIKTENTTPPRNGSSFSEDYPFKYKDVDGTVKSEKISQRTYQIGNNFHFEVD